MKIYTDIFSDDELCSDTFPMELKDDIIFEFKGSYVTRKEGEVVIDGMNASAEDEAEAMEDSAAQTGIDIVLNHSLLPMPIYEDPKIFKEYIKEYMTKLAKKLKEDGKSEEEVKKFKTEMTKWVGALIKKDRFKTLAFFAGEGTNAADGQLGILEYRDVNGEETPILMLVKAGLREEKV
jgi:hypothetical protein